MSTFSTWWKGSKHARMLTSLFGQKRAVLSYEAMHAALQAAYTAGYSAGQRAAKKQ